MGDRNANMSLGHLTYFPVMAKGLQLALIAEHSGLQWDGLTAGKGEGPDDWPGLKPKTPFGQMPFLETLEDGTIGQSTAIANYMGHKANIQGKTSAEFGRSQMCMAEAEDLYNMMGAMNFQRWKPAEAKCSSEDVETYWLQAVPAHLGNLESLCDQLDDTPGFTSTGHTTGEIYLWGMLHQMCLMRPSCIEAFPRLVAWYAAMLAEDPTQKVLNGTSAIGSLGQYFVNNA